MKYTLEQINSWKALYGIVRSISIAGTEFVYRPLSLSELKTLRAQEATYIEKLKKENCPQDEMGAKAFEYSSLLLCKTCVLFPDNFDFESGPAGALDTLQPLIMSASGYPEEPPQPVEL